MTSTELGVLFLDRACNVVRFTPRARDVVNVITSDLGRPLADLTHKLDTIDLTALARDVLRDLRTIEREVTISDGRRYLLRLLPYLLVQRSDRRRRGDLRRHHGELAEARAGRTRSRSRADAE